MEVNRCYIGENSQSYADKKVDVFILVVHKENQDPELYLQSRLLYQPMFFTRVGMWGFLM